MLNINILIIGCGHIAGFGNGALRPNHASEIKRCFGNARVTCVDIDPNRASSFAFFYGFQAIDDLSQVELNAFDLIVCATPPQGRLSILERLAAEISDTALVLLEKPITTDGFDLNRLSNVHKRFFVNFPRSFQTGIAGLTQHYPLRPKKIVVHYYKDMLSIGIHAFQLLSDLFTGLHLRKVTAMEGDYRAIMTWRKNSFPVYFLKTGSIDGEIFEVDIFSAQNRLRLNDFTETVEFYRTVENCAGESELTLKSRYRIQNDGFINLYDDLHKAITGEGFSNRLKSVTLERAAKIHNTVINHFDTNAP